MRKEGGMEGGNATLVESSPNPFTKAAEAANRSKNKKKALQQATLFMEEARGAREEKEHDTGRTKGGTQTSPRTSGTGAGNKGGTGTIKEASDDDSPEDRAGKRRREAVVSTKRKTASATTKEDPPDKSNRTGSRGGEGAKGKEDDQAKKGAAASNYLSALKSSKYANPPVQDWAYKRQIIKAQLQLGEGDRFAQYKKAIATILHNGRMADPSFVINAVLMNSGRKDWSSPADVPSNFTMLAGYIKLDWGSQRAFEAGNSQHNGKIYIQFAISCNADPSALLEMISLDWSQAGGTGLQVKDIPAFNTESPFAIYFLCNDVSPKTLTAELARMMEHTIAIETEKRRIAKENGNGEEEEELLQSVPKMILRKYPPKLPGADFSAITGGDTSGRAREGRKVWHIEIEAQFKHRLGTLIEKMKEHDTISGYWGRLVHISEVPDRGTSQGEIKKLTQVSQKHTCYQMSMVTEVVKGIVYADGTAKLYNKQGEQCGDMTMREVLLKLFKTRDGTTLIAEVHQQHGLYPTEVVIPGSDEAAAMIAMMNRQAAAFCYYYLIDRGLPEQFAYDLVKASCCPEQGAEIKEWKWDKKQRILLAPKGKGKERTEDLIKEFEALDCYKTLEKLTAGSAKKGFRDPRARFNIDEENSVGTMHVRNEEKRRLQKARQEEDSETGDEDDEDTGNGAEDIDAANIDVLSVNSEDSEVESNGDEGERVGKEDAVEEEASFEERSWKEEDEDDSEQSSTESINSMEDGDIGDGWGDQDVDMELDDSDSQADSSSAGSTSSKPLGSEDNDEEGSKGRLATPPHGLVQDRSSSVQAAGDE